MPRKPIRRLRFSAGVPYLEIPDRRLRLCYLGGLGAGFFESNAMRVLVVEDDVVTAARIEIVLQAEDFVCDLAHRGADGVRYAKLHAYDIILLDLMLPDMDGYDVLQQLREAQVETPVLILSGLSELDDKLKGLSFGADDFLTKPFEHRELIARIRAIVRRSKGLSQSTIRTGKLLLNLDNHTVMVEGQPVRLTSKEYALLELLSMRKRAARITSRPCAVSVTRCATPPNPRRRRSAPELGLRRYSPFVALLGVVTTGAEAAYTRAMRD